MDGLTPFGVGVFSLRVSSAVCQLVLGHFVLVSSVHPRSVVYGGY